MTSRSGCLLELVARGKKDLYFTANPTVSFFHSVYVRAAPFTKEIYVCPPRNNPEWGRYVDFDIEHRGDISKAFHLRITLPTWLPGPAAAANPTGIVTDASGVTYGWCNNIGFQILDSIQVFQDQLLIHEAYGEYLDWRLRTSYGFATSYLTGAEVGAREETTLGIGRSATIGTLRVPIPVFGWQHLYDPGTPLCALRNQRFRIRVNLRNLDDLIVASDGRLRPQPWELPLLIQQSPGGPIDTTQTSLPQSAMKPITMSLEQTVLYLPADVQTWFKAQTLYMPFLTVQHEQFTIEDNELTAAAANPAGVVQLPFELDFIGSVDRLLFACRSEASTQAGQRTNLRAPPRAGQVLGDPFLRTVRLNIANIDRVKQWRLPVVREVTSYWKSRRMGLDQADPSKPQEVYTLAFGDYDWAVPVGTLNFTRASLPTLYVTLNAIPYDPRNISRKTFLLTYVESWNIFEISGGRGKMKFDDS
jgi:hypothetical protein